MILAYGFRVYRCEMRDNVAYISLAAANIEEPTQNIKLEPRNK